MGLLSIRRERKIEIGGAAPDFEAETTDGQTFRLSELRGRPVLLAFLPCEWCAVCSIRLRSYERAAPPALGVGARAHDPSGVSPTRLAAGKHALSTPGSRAS